MIDIHTRFKETEKYQINRFDSEPSNIRKENRPILNSDIQNRIIEIDAITTLTDIPKDVWRYKLGTYSAIDWVLEQYKEKTPRHKVIQDKFNKYQFSDYKEQVIDLLMRVCTVSVETMRIIDEMQDGVQ